MKHVEPFFDCAGVIHIHTTASDSEKELSEILQVAEALGLDFLALGDHNVINPEYKGIQSSVVIVSGLEYTPGYSFEYDEEGNQTNFDSGPNHLLGIGVTAPGTEDFSIPQANIDTIAAQGGLSFLAHPADYWLPWEEWQVERYDGLEIWTYLSDWAESQVVRGLGAKALKSPDAVLSGPNHRIIEHWDAVGKQRRIIGIGSTDSHSKMQKLGEEYHMVFPLDKELHSIRTHVLLKDTLSNSRTEASAQIVEALSQGRCYIALDSIANATGFQFWLEMGGRRHDMGDEIHLRESHHKGILQVRVPHSATIKVLFNGKVAHQAEVDQLTMPIQLERGVYRVEVWEKDQIWTLSNPIYLRAQLSSSPRS
jgi:hypothetical protein